MGAIDNPVPGAPAGPAIDCPALSPETFARFAGYITGELGIKMPPSKATLIYSRLLRRVRELGLESVDRYADYFFDRPQAAERDYVVHAITTHKTEFFREPEHFDFLVQTALPSLDRSGGSADWRFKAWSAGCSSGEEPYTLAMVFSEYGRGRRGFDFRILGTDVSASVLEQAREGIYRESQVAPVEMELRRKYMLQSRDSERQLVRIVPALRRKVSFHPLNFMDQDYGVKDMFDVIFFRNVMIYFDQETQETVIARLCRNLAPGGYLFVGHSESLAGMQIPVKLLQASIYRKPL